MMGTADGRGDGTEMTRTSAAALVGRSAELAVLIDAVGRIPDGGGALVVHGAAGIGKSVLLAAAEAAAADAGFTVLATTGVENETNLPFAGLYALLLPVLDRAAALAPPQRRALLTAFGQEDGPAPEPFLIGLAALNLLTEAAAARPVLLVVDDVHWLDSPSHQVLGFLARRLGRDPVLLVGTVRDGNASPLLDAGLPTLSVRSLDDAAARALLRRHAGDLGAADHERILGQALGNPLALVELPAAVRSAGAVTEWTAAPMPLNARLERAFAARLPDLDQPTRDALLVAAVDSENHVAEILAGAAALAPGTPAPGVAVLDAAVAAGLVRIAGARLTFRHPLVRSGVLQSESAFRRQAAHAALAAVLAGEPYRRTWHRAHAIVGPDDDVADELEYAHGIAVGRGSAAAAIAALERSAQLTSSSATRGRRLLLAPSTLSSSAAPAWSTGCSPRPPATR